MKYTVTLCIVTEYEDTYYRLMIYTVTYYAVTINRVLQLQSYIEYFLINNSYKQHGYIKKVIFLILT